MLIPLVVALWERKDYGGVKRTLIENVNDLADWNFSKRASAVGIHPGPSFNLWTYFTPTVTFLGEDRNAGTLTLGPGAWHDLSLFGWDNRIVSLTFNLNNSVAIGAQDSKSGRHITIPSPPAAPIWRIPLVLDAWTDWSPYPEPEGYPPGKRVQIVEDCASLTTEFGSEYNDSIKTLRVRRGPDYAGYDVVRLCRDDDFQNGYDEYGPDERIGIADWGTDAPWTSSVYFTQPPRHPIGVLQYLSTRAAPIDWSAMAALQNR